MYSGPPPRPTGSLSATTTAWKSSESELKSRRSYSKIFSVGEFTFTSRHDFGEGNSLFKKDGAIFSLCSYWVHVDTGDVCKS